MKIALLSSCVPHVDGGYRNIVDWLAPELRAHGHEVETIYLPFDETPDALLANLTFFRALDLSESADRLVTFRPPAHLSEHPNKVVWFIHHLRGYFDLWDTPYRPVPDTPRWRATRGIIQDLDSRALKSARRVYSNSAAVSQRLAEFNGVDAPILYPPIHQPDRFTCEEYGDEIVSVCRLEPHKRTHLLIEAMQHVRTPVRLRVSGVCPEPAYAARLAEAVSQVPADRVTLEPRWISEEEKQERMSQALANAYLAFDEDSYGYPTLEAAHARKASVVAADGGGVRELVRDGETGLIVEPTPMAIAQAFDQLWTDRAKARRLGEAAFEHIQSLDISWSRVVEALTA